MKTIYPILITCILLTAAFLLFDRIRGDLTNDNLLRLQHTNDSINECLMQAELATLELSAKLDEAKLELSEVRGEVKKIETRYSERIKRLTAMTPVEIEGEFNDIYLTDTIANPVIIDLTQAAQAIETHEEVVYVRDLYDNCNTQISKLEKIIVVQESEKENAEKKNALLTEKVFATEKHLTATILLCEEANKQMKKDRQKERIFSAAIILIIGVLAIR